MQAGSSETLCAFRKARERSFNGSLNVRALCERLIRLANKDESYDARRFRPLVIIFSLSVRSEAILSAPDEPK